MPDKQSHDLGVTQHPNGLITFAVWAPFANEVYLSGDFNNWSETDTRLTRSQEGNWHVEIECVKPGQQYKYIIHNGKKKLKRNDPRALQLTSAQDASIVVDYSFDWQDDDFKLPPKNQQVIYEMHIGTFNRPDPATPGTFETAIAKLDYLRDLGINVVELLPINGTNMERWWGYEPTYLYSVEAAYGGRKAFQEFVREAHKRGIGVIIDVVYNHLSPEPNFDLWRFDGWSKPGKGGIYFYSDSRIETPWGPRPDYGRPEVRDYITDSVKMWFETCRIDGLRVDAVFSVRNSKGYNDDPEHDIAEGWLLLQDINQAAHELNPNSTIIAEDVASNSHITIPTKQGGAGFDSQWETTFPTTLRDILKPVEDRERDLQPLVDALQKRYNNDVFERVIYSESHDADANGNARMNAEIDPDNADGLLARKRSMLAAAIILTAPGIPMLFQGQEFMEEGWFNHWDSLDWARTNQFVGTIKFYQDVISLRRNLTGISSGLQGQDIDVMQHDSDAKVLCYSRSDDHQPVVIVANFSNRLLHNYEVKFPSDGLWYIRLNSDWQGYSTDFTNLTVDNIQVTDTKSKLSLAPYSILIFTK